MNTYIPYTYRVTSKTTGQHYYGVRYKQGCHPSDFWVEYFTSSKQVHNLIEQYGPDDFIREIRKTFTTATAAINWEEKVLTKLNVIERNDWLNVWVFSNTKPQSGTKRGPNRRTRQSPTPSPIPDSFDVWMDAYEKETDDLIARRVLVQPICG